MVCSMSNIVTLFSAVLAHSASKDLAASRPRSLSSITAATWYWSRSSRARQTKWVLSSWPPRPPAARCSSILDPSQARTRQHQKISWLFSWSVAIHNFDSISVMGKWPYRPRHLQFLWVMETIILSKFSEGERSVVQDVYSLHVLD